ncbi:MAG: FAD-dependent oxidoreductase [Candidatus Dormibacteraeota bacterium]|nr:FAD-dependent oxidoreductase [Candidatus Dormibacteraeota bacterium]
MGADKVVVVGGGGAGDAVAFALRKNGFEGEVTILSADLDRPYDRPYLSKEFMRGEIELPQIYLHEESAYAEQELDLRLDQRVTGGSLAERRLTLDGAADVAFDTLVLATGGTPRRLPGVPAAENVFTLRSRRDSQAIHDAVVAGSRLLLVGAGFIGAEVAASARALGRDVLIVEAARVPLSRALGEEVGEVYAEIHRSHGVDVRTGTTIDTWHSQGDRVVGVTLSDGRREEVSTVLLGVGIDPNLELARALRLPTGDGGVRVDSGLRAADGIYCAGDIALHPHPVLGRELRVEHWEVAKGHGRAVGRAIARGDRPYSALPYFWSDQYDVSLEYRGQGSGEDRLVWRGDREARQFSVFYLHEGLVDGVLSVNDSDTNEAGGKLIAARRPIDAALLADSATDLAEFAARPGEE